MPRANHTATSFSRGLGSDFGTGVLVKTFSRSEKSIRNCPAIGSSSLPWWRKATRCFAVDQAPASSSGFSTPEACLRMASSDWRMIAGRTLMAHRVANLFNFQEIGKRIGLGERYQTYTLPVD